ncbi:hypothetical protein GPECTOR_36g76 [Gonium pectorale]|uniref:Exostosin GT47 domain-containing protein n=1 Tax=Gonium pectorale TaxID=33097 RepID=A0A150GC62_GONPE|nr:hypothetical protein GPECTOR_36g76 [Gonium pectorale]|eukprot:KXZ47353.1 hypothetical protein GPECTOR_36g76 [Gonium pectorale]
MCAKSVRHYLALDTTPGAPAPADQMLWELTWGPIDLLVCISPELDHQRGCLAAAAALHAGAIVGLVHRADLIRPNGRYFSEPPAPLSLLALSPHVVEPVRKRMKGFLTVGWAMLVAPFEPAQPCTSRACLQGFTVQGSLRKWSTGSGSGLIRNFTSLWEQLQRPGAERVNITVLGKGSRADLDIPPQLDSRVEFYGGLPYPAFWQKVCTSYALIPAFGNNQYLTTRLSSTVLASLTTCVPIIATREFLDAYSFLSEDHVFLQYPGEREANVMRRVLELDDATIFGKRRALCALRQRLGQQAAAVLRGAVSVARAKSALTQLQPAA